jgi:hypothetical protein
MPLGNTKMCPAEQSNVGVAPAPNESEPRQGKPWAIVDASSAAFGSTTPGQRPVVSNIRVLFDELNRHGIGYDAIADASLRHNVDSEPELEQLFRKGKLLQAPAAAEADPFLIQLATKRLEQGYDVYLVTNDLFKDHCGSQTFRRIGFIISPEGWVLSWPEIGTLGPKIRLSGVGSVPSASSPARAPTQEIDL